jgi:hypothetical protein
MQVGDKFYTIAYTYNPRVIEVEVIEIKEIDSIVYIHFQNTNDNFDKWFLQIETVIQWKFKTRELAENKLKEFSTL